MKPRTKHFITDIKYRSIDVAANILPLRRKDDWWSFTTTQSGVWVKNPASTSHLSKNEMKLQVHRMGVHWHLNRAMTVLLAFDREHPEDFKKATLSINFIDFDKPDDEDYQYLDLAQTYSKIVTLHKAFRKWRTNYAK